MSSTFKPPVTVTTDSSGNIIVTPSSAIPPPPPVTTGNFGPEWFYQPAGGGATGTVQQVNGVLQTRLQNPGGDDSNYGYTTAQRGSFPWGSSQGDPLPANIQSVQVQANLLVNQFISGHSHAQYYIGLYYRCAAAFNGWLDTQVRVEWIDRAQSPDGTESTYGGSIDPGVQADGYSRAQTSPSFNIDVEAQFQAAAKAWNIDPASPHSLDGIEIGSEGFGVTELDVDFLSYNLSTGPVTNPPPPPPTQLAVTFIVSPGPVALSELFTGQASGGTPPYSYGWDFGDSLGAALDIIQHVYLLAGNYTVTLTVTDSLGAKATTSQSITVSATLPPPPPPGIEQVVIVIFENTGLPTTLGVPGFAAFAKANALSTNWSHLGHPSEPNYVGIAFGDMLGVSSDGQNPSLPPPTILDVVKASGRSYKVIQNGSRGADHNGFLLESPDISNTVQGDSPDVVAAVDAGVNFVWFTPSDSQNAHDNGISSAWDWFNSWLPQLQTALAKRNSLLILTFDESFDDSVVYTVFAGPAAKQGYSSSNPYNHYSFGKLIESLWGGSGLRNCDSAAAPTEFFR